MHAMALSLALLVPMAELESRQLTHYVPQDLLEKAVRTEGWTEIRLDVKGGVLKGDIVRIWSGGLIDCGNGDQPGVNVHGPSGQGNAKPGNPQSVMGIPGPANTRLAVDISKLVLSQKGEDAFALLVKTEGPDIRKCVPPGKPLEIKLTKDKEKLYIGFNDEKGRFADNHLGKGKRHELDPLWVRIEVVRIIVD
jgi:hypothetical protein